MRETGRADGSREWAGDGAASVHMTGFATMAFLVEMPDGGFLEVEERVDVAPDDLSVIGILGASPLEGTGLITFGAVIRSGSTRTSRMTSPTGSSTG